MPGSDWLGYALQMKTLLLFFVFAPAFGQVSVSMQRADQAMIPGSVRSVYAKVDGSPNLTVQWSVNGGCTIARASSTGEPQQVIAPERGGKCTYTLAPFTDESPSFSSPVSCKVTATSAADSSKSASIVLPVCAPQIELSTFPVATVLYKHQFAVIQSDLRGSTNTGVTWVLTSNPGGAGSLTGGTANRHAVFSASAPGIYVVTATSAADPHKQAFSTIYVTAHELPAPTGDHTQPIDCTAVGNRKTYEVGPARAYADLNAVPWNSLAPGDTVRIHNDDLTGKSPTTYHQHISIPVGGTASEPLRICGVPDAGGVKPIVDGENATSRKDAGWAGGSLEDLGLITLYDSAHKFDEVQDGNQDVMIEGLHLRNARPSFSFTRQAGSDLKPYSNFAACIRIQTGRDVLIRGNQLENCTQGIFTNAQTPQGNLIYDLTVEGNYVNDWGAQRNESVHAMYLQAIGLQAQFNYFGPSAPGAGGNVIKSRSVLNFLRWNYMAQPVASTARAFDMVEPQAFNCYVIPFDFALVYHAGKGTDCGSPHKGYASDTFPPDQVAANFEAYHSDYVYGNILDDTASRSAYMHYGYDQQTANGPGADRRGGTLYYWNNTHLSRRATALKTIVDASAPDQGKSYEFPIILSLNNVFATINSISFQWTRAFWTQMTVDTNWIDPKSSPPNRSTKDQYQGGTSAAELATCDPYGNCKPANGHLVWARNGKAGTPASTLYTGPLPFNPETFLPNSSLHGLASPLPKAIQDQPSNMEFLPAASTVKPRQDKTYLGALD